MNELKQLRVVGFLEGLSYVILLFLAMPLKYVFDWPLGVRIVGGAHGVLFLLYVVVLYRVYLERDWSLKKTAVSFLGSLIPFGTFWLEKGWKEEQLSLEKQLAPTA